MYYGEKVTNYTANGATWRIFYVDTTNKYGDGINSVYLIADYDDNRTQILGTKTNNEYKAYAYQSDKTKIREMNPTWNEYRKNIAESNWSENEKATAYLCDTSKWTTYCDITTAKYAIGSPSLEMYADSYNMTHDSTSIIYTCTPTVGTEATNVGNGYFVGTNGVYLNNGLYTQNYLSDTEQSKLYKGGANATWIASPSAETIGHVCDLFPRSGIGKYFLNLARRVRPVVCLQADTTIKIEL